MDNWVQSGWMRQQRICLRVIHPRSKGSWIFIFRLLSVISWKLLLGCISSLAFSVCLTLWLNGHSQLQKALMQRGGMLRNGDCERVMNGASITFATLGYEPSSPSVCRTEKSFWWVLPLESGSDRYSLQRLPSFPYLIMNWYIMKKYGKELWSSG